jgi:hypothetical protein
LKISQEKRKKEKKLGPHPAAAAEKRRRKAWGEFKRNTVLTYVFPAISNIHAFEPVVNWTFLFVLFFGLGHIFKQRVVWSVWE